MNKEWLKTNWLKIVSTIIGLTLVLYFFGCPPQTQSLIDPTKKVTAPELQIEIDTLVSKYELRRLNLEQQDQLRQLILNNALVMVQQGQVNPLGILTALFAFYGVGSAANTTKNVIKKKIHPQTNGSG